MINISGYQITKQLYESSHSLIYRGYKISDQQPVIFKMLKETYPNPEQLAWFKREYEVTRTLKISGVVEAYKFLDEQKHLIIVLEDFGGDSLAMLQVAGQMPLSEFLRLAIDITEILGAIHAANVIHKDINPSNIVFNRATKQVKIIDFGISSVLSRENQTFRHPNILEGTLAYMSPEQTGRMNRSIDYRTDFYALGVTFYELLTGQLPFPKSDALELVHSHIAKQAVPPHELVGEYTCAPIPPIISEIVMKLMAKNPENRYQSAYGLKADLEQCLHQLQTTGEIVSFSLGQQDIADKFQIPQKLYGREQEIAKLLAAFARVAGDAGKVGVAGNTRDARDENFAQRNRVSPRNRVSVALSPTHQSKIQNLKSKIQNPKSKIEMVLVGGYSGVGKSALVREIYKPITARRGNFISGKFDQFQRNIPYSAISQAFNELCNQLLSESSSVFNEWKEKILAAVGDNGQILIDVIPSLEFILGSQPPVAQVGAVEAQNRFNLVCQNFIRAISQAEHPLVLFIDDLQWADGASLSLLKIIMSDRTLEHILILGAYRDNEVDATHPLMMTLEEIAQEEGLISFIHLNNLTKLDINTLIAETLACSQSSCQQLTELVYKKTQGNAFFTIEFFKCLYVEKVLKFNYKLRQWQWDIGQIQLKNITANVVELMVGKINKLPEKTQTVLKLAACIGHSFDLLTLATISQQDPSQVFTELFPGLQEGLVFSLNKKYKLLGLGDDSFVSEVRLQFLHDRVQQAAYSLIEETQKQSTHLQIGRLLLANSTQEDLEEKIFDIVDQFNQAIDLINLQPEKIKIAELNLIAGEKALATMAYEPSFKYFQIGIKLLNADSWQQQYNLTLNLYSQAAQTAYLSCHFEQMEQLTLAVLNCAKTNLEKLKVCEVKIKALTAQSDLKGAIHIALEFLQWLGVIIPEKPSQLDIQQALSENDLLLADREVEDLIHLPEMTQPEKSAVLMMLESISAVAYIGAPELFFLIILVKVNLSIQYGNSSESAFAYAFYAVALCGGLQKIELGHRFGHLSLTLAQKFSDKKVIAKSLAIFAQVLHWKEHIKKALVMLSEAYKGTLETGDFEFAAYSAYGWCQFSFFIGQDLLELEKQIANYNQAIGKLKQEMPFHWTAIYWQTVQNLLERSENPIQLVGSAYDENQALPILMVADDKVGLHIFYLNKLILCYLFGELSQAQKNADMAQQYLQAALSLLVNSIFHFYDSLTQLAIFAEHPNSDKTALMNRVNRNQEKMHHWAMHAPMNFQHKYDLIEAEKARVLAQTVAAMDGYETAIKGARNHGYFQEEALAYELAAKFYLDRGMEEIAQTYITRAYYGYVRWQALTKVKHLAAQYPDFLTTNPTKSKNTTLTFSTSTTHKSESKNLDLTSILKASQTLAGEIVLDVLLAKIMRFVLENAGAEKGYLILKEQSQWNIEAVGNMNLDEAVVLQSIPMTSVNENSITPLISAAIANYVIRTQESVVLHDAAHQGNFTHDPYIIQQQPKSVLCAPLLNQGQLTAILYLENNLTTGAFTPDRLEVLNLLASQAAISIKNAQLYANVCQNEHKLTQLVAEQTEALRCSEQQFKNAFETTAVGMCIVSLEGRFLAVNPSVCKMFGYPEAELLSLTFQEITYPDDLEVDLNNVQELLAGNISYYHLEKRYIQKNGQIVWGLLSVSLVRDSQQTPLYFVSQIQNISARKEAETVLLHAVHVADAASRAKSEFLANMSHELRTPLNAILGYSQIMNRDNSLSTEHKQFLAIINRAGEHLLQLINDVLEMSKIEAGRMSFNPSGFNLHQLLNNLEEMLRLQAKYKNLQLFFERASNLPQYVQTDEQKLRQVLINLLGNSLKFTRQGHVILRVSLETDKTPLQSPLLSPQSLTFEVEDTGLGIAPNELDTLFDAFVQTQAGRKASQGTGLGLAISRQFVQLMGGDITVNSILGQGTIFKFDISITLAEATDVQSEQPIHRGRVLTLAPDQPQYRILIVEDQWTNRQLLVQLLEPLGFKVREAENGREGLALWERWEPHLIWMDMRMPVMDGYQATKQIKAQPKGQSTVIIALTANAFEEERTAILAAGCDDLVLKPFREEVILEKMAQHLGVGYVYDESNLSSAPSDRQEEEDKIYVLKAESLNVMPADWIAQLHQAAVRLDDKQMIELLTQIPQSNALLARALTQKVDNFDFDQIMNLTQQASFL
ncbi:PAS domain S-box protein [Scytonema hofmannii PCC 7110]|uniref:Circadian input-output histidine kinase CikA n=2 Tax=Scytonema hofmannii TaxID=34078 RepID=A0A139WWZ4_9CYAN|nr:PAS domain S-box protein [Scytonema hofmannii PCC 7110]